tara:strand:+ start:1305 stop:1415 length:111 start_codon:yes stop_codon:yes gene_type:complete
MIRQGLKYAAGGPIVMGGYLGLKAAGILKKGIKNNR